MRKALQFSKAVRGIVKGPQYAPSTFPTPTEWGLPVHR